MRARSGAEAGLLELRPGGLFRFADNVRDGHRRGRRFVRIPRRRRAGAVITNDNDAILAFPWRYRERLRVGH